MVIWRDAEVGTGWTDKADVGENEEAPLCYTVGFLIKRGKEAVIVSHTISGKECNGWITIPAGFIESIEKI